MRRCENALHAGCTALTSQLSTLNCLMRPWLQLFRVPNLFTVPGDPIAGFLLAAGWMQSGRAQLDGRAAAAVAASLCLYAAGLAMNDLADLDEDRRERPERPLPSGAVPVRAARFAALALIAAGFLAMGLAAGMPGAIMAVALAVCVAFYNGWAKRIPILGALVMGACRGASVMLGAVAFTGTLLPLPLPAFAGAALVALYIAAVTNLARHETRASSPPLARALPLLPILLGLTLALRFTGPFLASWCTTLFAVTLFFVSLEAGRLFRAQPPPLPPVIGALIRVLLPLQAALCLVFGASPHARIAAGALLLLMPLARLAGRRFYAS